jgi:hypothetical protein
MNNKNWRPPNRRPQQEGPQFCARCGGALHAQNGGNTANVCRCKKG